MRSVIERVFRTKVFNRYGSREVGNVASECECHTGLHVSSPSCIVEVVRPDGSQADPEEVGEIVVTLLTNRAMPLIRYRIGDMGAWAAEGCPCGRGFPLLRYVQGRVSDSFVSREGARVHGEYFTHLLYFRPWVERFQFVQETPDLIRIAVVLTPGEGIPEDHRADIEDKIRLVMGAHCRVQWHFPDEIRPSDSGKYRYTISNYVERS